MLVDAATPTWSVRYTNDAFTAATGDSWGTQQLRQAPRTAGWAPLPVGWLGAQGQPPDPHARACTAHAHLPRRRRAARRGHQPGLLGNIQRARPGPRLLPGAPPRQPSTAERRAALAGCLQS